MKEYSEDIIQKAVAILEKERIYDYEVSDKISKHTVTITSDLGNLEIWIPEDYEYSQYQIEDFIRDMLPYAYISTRQEGDKDKLTLKSRLNFQQYVKLLKHIVKKADFVTILE
ncbi:MAG: hypothetical protein HUJ56_01705 [Erysipelotrichaceae bacterium]|nr:hypothetical protein [Erysipelotrichaceae bacterium]